jgi:hypothetical protein
LLEPLAATPLFKPRSERDVPAQGGRFAFISPPDGATLLVLLEPPRSTGALLCAGLCNGVCAGAVGVGATWALGPLYAGEPERPAFGVAEGGRFELSSRCRAETGADCDCVTGADCDAGALPAGEGFGDAAPRELIAGLEPLVGLPTTELPRPVSLPGVSVLALTVCTGICDAAGAGAVRATTGRLITEAGGAATCLPAFAPPK